jgi:hypothetical protein
LIPLADLLRALEGAPTGPPICRTCGAVVVRRLGADCPPCAEAAAAAERREAITRAWKTTPDVLHWVAFDAPGLDKWVTDATAIAAARGALDARLVTLTGPNRAGKTVIACCMFREHLRRGARKKASPRERVHARRGRFETTHTLIREREETRLGEEHMPVRDVCEHASLLVLDNLEDANDPHRVIYTLLHNRHADGRQTIVTTWLDREQCAAVHGGGLAGRLFEDGVVIQVRKEGGTRDLQPASGSAPPSSLEAFNAHRATRDDSSPELLRGLQVPRSRDPRGSALPAVQDARA